MSAEKIRSTMEFDVSCANDSSGEKKLYAATKHIKKDNPNLTLDIVSIAQQPPQTILLQERS